MAATDGRTVTVFGTVFGGTGFLGRHVVRHLRKDGFSVRVASRHPDRGHRLFGLDDPQLQSVGANIHDERSVADALIGAYGVVNTVSLYVEHGRETFHSVHVESAQRLAAQVHGAGVKRVAHVSGIGADATSQSLYVRKRGEGERVVRAAFADSVLIRPAVMFGPDDAFLTTILKLLRQLPINPMFGHGLTRMQPAYVKDVAEAIARALGPKRMRPHMSVAVLTPTLTRNFSGRSRAKPASSPYSFQSHLQLGMCWHAYRKCFRVYPSLGLKWN
jgi:uncharacterized protein YbjT (DUF2867 family)